PPFPPVNRTRRAKIVALPLLTLNEGTSTKSRVAPDLITRAWVSMRPWRKVTRFSGATALNPAPVTMIRSRGLPCAGETIESAGAVRSARATVKLIGALGSEMTPVGPSIVVTTIWTAPGTMSGTSTRSAGWFVASKTISFLIGSMTAMTAPLRTKPTMLLRGLGMKPAPVMIIFAPAGADAGDTAAGLGAGCATVTTALDSSEAPGTVASAVIVATPGPIRVTLNEAVVRPAGIVTFAGTVATCGLSLTSVTVRPLVDGGCVSVTSIFAAGEFEAKLIANGESARPI